MRDRIIAWLAAACSVMLLLSFEKTFERGDDLVWAGFLLAACLFHAALFVRYGRRRP